MPCRVPTKLVTPGVRSTVAAMPTISAKNITAIRSPLAADWIGLRGTMLSRICMNPISPWRAAIAAVASDCCAIRASPTSRGMPPPGWNTFTASRPMHTASVVTTRM